MCAAGEGGISEDAAARKSRRDAARFRIVPGPATSGARPRDTERDHPPERVASRDVHAVTARHACDEGEVRFRGTRRWSAMPVVFEEGYRFFF